MIHLRGNYYNLESNHEEIMSLIYDSISVSNEALDYFLDYIHLDKTLFSHLKDATIIIDNEKLEELVSAYFIVRDDELKEPVIHLFYKFLDNMVNVTKKDGKRNASVNELAWSILHERIHLNRNILINNLITYQDTFIIANGDSVKFNSIYSELENLLSIYYIPKKKYNILKVIIEDKYYDVYTYNELLDKYEIYLFNREDFTDLINLSDELVELLLINYSENYALYEPYACIKRISKYNEEDMCMNYDYNSNNLIVPFSKEESEIERRKIALNIGLEEAFTEALAGIMVIMNKDRSLTIVDACNILNRLINNYDVKLALNLIKNMSIEDIRWFMVSCYQESYEDRFNTLIQSDYQDLLNIFNNLYDNTNNCDSKTQESYNNGLEIIKRNLSLKK